MSAVVDFVVSWKDLITKVFGEYPLAAAIFTLAAVGVFFGLEREWRKGKTPTNLMAVFIGWAIVVPIGGWVLSILGKVWSVIESTVPIITTVIGSLYRIYEKHPIVVLSIMGVALVAYPIWKWRFAKFLPNRALRISLLVVGVIVATHIASPIADLFSPLESSAPPKAEKTVPQQPPAPQVPPTSSSATSQVPTPPSAQASSSTPVPLPPTANPAVEGTLRDKAAQRPLP